MEAKRIHGQPRPLHEKLSLQSQPPIPCEFALGDQVIYTNDYGLKATMEVCGFSENDEFGGRFIHIVRPGGDYEGCAWWFPHRPSELAHM